MNSMIEEILKQQKLFDQLTGGSQVRELLRQTSLTQELLDQYNEVERYRRLANPLDDFFKSHDGEMIRRLANPTDDIVRLANTPDLTDRLRLLGLTGSQVEGIRSALGLSVATESAFDQWRRYLDASPLSRAFDDINQTANAHLGGMEAVTATWSQLAKEMESASKWMVGAEDFASTVGAIEASLAKYYGTDAIYEELRRRFQRPDPDSAASIEAEAESYFQIILGFLLLWTAKVTPHNPAHVLEFLIGVFFHIHALHWEAAMTQRVDGIDAKVDEQRIQIEHLKASNERSAAVLASLEKKLEELNIAKCSPGEEIEWAALNKLAPRAEPRSKAAKRGELIAGEIAIQRGEHGKWVQLEFVDAKTGVRRLGWVMKKQMERVTPRKQPNRRRH